MGIKTRKIKLIPIADDSKGRTKIYNYMRDISKDLATIGNEIIRNHVVNNFNVKKVMDEQSCTKGDAIKIISDNLGTSLQNSGYRITSDIPHIASNVRTCFNQKIFKTIKENFFDILNNKVSIPSFKSTNLPLTFSNIIYKENNKYFIDFPLTLETKKTLGDVKFDLFFGKDKSNNKVIADRIIDGTYKMCGSSISYDGKDLFLFLTVDIPNKVSDADVSKIMGIDLGINRPVSIYITDEARQPYQIDINNKIQYDRMRMSKQRKTIQESLKYSAGGHGTSKKLKALEQFRLAEANWAQTINHKISAAVIKMATDYRVGIIRMEDLTGITTNATDYYFKSWSYYQLQNYIKYKAEEVGIKIEWVIAKNTSRECPTCHNIHEDNRNKIDVTKFACINASCKDYLKTLDADIVAATNIANKNGTNEKEKSKAGKLKKFKKDLVASE